jgi:hypothetical protein
MNLLHARTPFRVRTDVTGLSWSRDRGLAGMVCFSPLLRLVTAAPPFGRVSRGGPINVPVRQAPPIGAMWETIRLWSVGSMHPIYLLFR